MSGSLDLYKIIAKLLSLRLAPAMLSIISPFQVAFIKGRRLQDAYADDFLLFGNASRQQIVRTWLILRVFELISGLSINSAKCQLSLIHADPATILLAEACFGCKASSLPMEYLGLQITLSPPAPSFWNGMEQKLNDRLQCWQGKLLSLPGRITLAKHCLASVPLHALAVFRPPVAVLSRFNKLIRKFIWDGDRPSDRLAHWDVVAFPRLLRGAGVTNLSRACESSLCSWWWRLATEHSLITQFIISKFDLPSPSVWNSSISHASPSHFWCDMLFVLPLFLRLADLSSSASPSWPLSLSREFTFSSCYLASFGSSVSSLPPRSLWFPGPSPRATAFVWLLLTGHINTFDHLQRLGISLANQCPLCLVATESRSSKPTIHSSSFPLLSFPPPGCFLRSCLEAVAHFSLVAHLVGAQQQGLQGHLFFARFGGSSCARGCPVCHPIEAPMLVCGWVIVPLRLSSPPSP
ncbi:putative ribonuclease H protein [Nymphaea thermarum]|nr:putative ribonuclease H protein [Nymphaea thermarum]